MLLLALRGALLAHEEGPGALNCKHQPSVVIKCQSGEKYEILSANTHWLETLELTLRDLAAALGEARRVGVTRLVRGA